MGTLYIVSTPIGNLKDITLRAIETLKSVDYIACEDTRVTGRLLGEYEITSKMVALNDFNEERKAPEIIADLKLGLSIALVSDAGTPLVSDPGYKLVRGAIKENIMIEAIPGPTAAIDALTVSGLPPDKFLFVGFLPKKDGKRREMLEAVKKSRELIKSTAIIYESPYRLIKTLESIKGVFDDIDVVVCRELTKIHEEVLRDAVSELVIKFNDKSPKGEFVILL